MRRLFVLGVLLVASGCGGGGPAMQAPTEPDPAAEISPEAAPKGLSTEVNQGPAAGLGAAD